MSSSRSQVPDARPELVLFDAGGTLVLINSDPFNAFLAGWDLPAVKATELFEAHFKAMSEFAYRLEAGEGLEFRWWVKRLFDLVGVSLTADMAGAFGGGKNMWNQPISGARETVVDLQARGYRVAVVSNSDGTVAQELARAGFGGLFEVVIDSTDVAISKPDPGIFEIALQALDVPAANTWYVGDSHFHDVGGAQSAGLAASVLIDPLSLGPAGMLSVSSIAELSGLLP